MELLSIGSARSVWLFDINELNPSGKSIFPEILVWMGEQYSFQTFPKSLAEIDVEKKGFLFKAGKFQTTDDSITVNFSLFSDGVVAETWASTEKGDAFIEEVLRTATRKYDLTFRPDMIRAKHYVSEVNVRLNYPLNRINPGTARFCGQLDETFARHRLAPFEMTGMIFGQDTSSSSYKPAGLYIERKTGA